MEGMRQLDEYRVQLEKLPPLSAALAVPRPLEPKLRDLAPEELDVFQAVLEAETDRARCSTSRQLIPICRRREAARPDRQGLRRRRVRPTAREFQRERRAFDGAVQLDAVAAAFVEQPAAAGDQSASTSASL